MAQLGRTKLTVPTLLIRLWSAQMLGYVTNPLALAHASAVSQGLHVKEVRCVSKNIVCGKTVRLFTVVVCLRHLPERLLRARHMCDDKRRVAVLGPRLRQYAYQRQIR